MESNQEILNQIAELRGEVAKVYKSVEKTCKYFLAVLIITSITLIVLLIGLLFAVPYYLNVLNQALSF